MNDEAHGNPSDATPDSVLRPFEPPAQAPLPPVEPSRVVPPPPVIPAPPVDADDEPEVAADAFLAADQSPAADAFFADHDSDTSSPGPDPEPPAADSKADELLTEPAEVAVPVAEAEAASPTVTLPKTVFLVGLGALLAVIAVLAVLWQSSADDDPATVSADDVTSDGDSADTVDESPDTTVDLAPVDDPDTVPLADLDAAEADLDAVSADLATATAEVASLQSTVETLEARPPAPLPGSSLRRIVIGSDAKYISTLPTSVAVVGAFGGVSLIDPETNRVVANANIANTATRVLRTSTSVWLTDYADSLLIRVDPVTNAVAAFYPFPGPDGIEKDGDSLVVASFDQSFVARVDPNDGTIVQRVDVGGKPTDILSHPDHGLWVALFDTGEIVQIDPTSFEVVARVTVGQGPVGLAAGPAAIWVTNNEEGTVAKVDPATGEVLLTTPVGNGPTDAVVANGSVWITVTDDGALAQVAAVDGTVESITPLGGASAGGGPTGIAATEGSLWIAMQGEQSVVRVGLP
ncbi:MAG: YncE family protein [Acidimicrobiales bacterium]